MADSFFNASARAKSGHYPFLEYAFLKDYFIGNNDARIFTAHFSEIAYSIPKHDSKMWNPSEGGKIYNAVGYVLDKLQQFMEESREDEHKYVISVMQDMYIPLMNYMESHSTSDDHLCEDSGDGAPIERFMPVKAFHEGMLPDHVSDLMDCSFWSDNGKMNPIVHLLSKSTPQRCQIRSLTLIMLNYCKVHDEVYNFVIQALKCSMLGAYRGTKRPPLHVRKNIYKVFNNMKRKEFLLFMQNNHQQLLFFTIKEYLVFAAKHIPALHSELLDRYKWREFEKRVTTTMDTIRSMISENDIMGFVGVERYLTGITRLQPHLYRPRKHTFCRVLMHECEHHDDVHAIASGRHKYWQLMYDMLIRVPLQPMPIEWLHMFGVPENVIKQLLTFQKTYNQSGSRGSIRAFIKALDRTHLETIRALARAYDRKINVRMFTLPVHITVQQIMALRHMHNVKDGEEMHETIGKTLICMECHQFKGFVAYRTSKKIHNIHAYGQSRVIVDDDTGKMYCGKRCDKVDKKRNIESYTWDEEVNLVEKEKRKSAKDLRKEHMYKLCLDNELQAVSLIGNMLQFYNVLYTICPQCGNFMKYDPKHMYNGFYCGCCMEHGHLFRNIKCEWCKSKQHLETVKVSGDKGNIFLCKTCHKPWIRNATGILSLQTIRKGLLEKWKRLQTM